MVLSASSGFHPKALISPRFSVDASSAPVNLQPSQLPFIAEVKSKLQDGDYKVETSPCVCGEAAGVVISEVDRYGLPLDFVLCTVCGTLRIDPYLDSPSLEDFYTRFYQQMYARATDVQSYFLRQKSYGRKVLAVTRPDLKPGSWVFEVGCGAGGALDVFQRQGYQVAGCDYSAELIAAGRKLGVQNIYHGSLKDIQPHLDGAKADLIYLNHVFEHVKHPLQSLDDCRHHLAPGGRIVIIVPDVSGIDRYPYPAGDLLQFLHIAHKYNFSFAGLRRLAGEGGYQVRRLTPDPKIQTPTSHSPELWLEFTFGENATRPGMESARPAEDAQGGKMLQYLRRTEKLYALGLCRGQLRGRLSAGKNSIGNNLGRLSRVTPAKVIRKLKEFG
jgi:SAM-dependent methyltransferase